jgi:predicted AlkP superfamily phosphohydrolase/phosphomutase
MKMKENPRVIVIGLDGATWDLINPWAEEGKLPTFSKLMKEGTWGILESLELPISSAAWTTLTTGVNPGKHGIFDFSIRKNNSYERREIPTVMGYSWYPRQKKLYYRCTTYISTPKNSWLHA